MKFENMCRTCLRIPDSLSSLLENEELLHKIKIISSVQIQSGDELPLWICQECIENVNRSFNFRKVIVNSDIELKERLAVFKRLEEIARYKKLQEEETDINDDPSDDPQLAQNDDRGSNTNESNELREKKNQTDTRIRLTLGRSVYNCTQCDYETVKFSEWCAHKKSHVLKKVCHVCGKWFRADNLHKHIRSHTEEPVKCPQCDKVFKNTESMRYHLYNHRGQNEGETFQCEICGQNYSCRIQYVRHQKRHFDPNARKGKCDVCGKVLTDKKRMKAHMRTHTGERPYSCEHCGKSFSTHYARNIHRRLHTNEKPYKCDYCSAAFTVKVSLCNHLKSKHKDLEKNTESS